MRMFFIAGAFALVSVSAPAVAAEEKDDRYDPKKVICKTVTLTGSRLPKERVCLTRKQWNDMSSRTQDEINSNMENGRRINSPRG